MIGESDGRPRLLIVGNDHPSAVIGAGTFDRHVAGVTSLPVK
ncbi:hypothetical protein [Dasania marina]